MLNTPDLSRYGWNKAARRYVYLPTGRFVSANDLRAAVDTVIDATTQDIRALSQHLVDGRLTLAQWQSRMAGDLKALYVAVGVAAGGGFAQMTQADYGYLGSLIKPQYAYLRDFAAQIADGQQPLDGTLLARAALYAQAARGIFEDMARHLAEASGMQRERRNLGPADHCSGCLRQAALGWQPIGTLLPIGATACLANCRCSFAFS